MFPVKTVSENFPQKETMLEPRDGKYRRPFKEEKTMKEMIEKLTRYFDGYAPPSRGDALRIVEYIEKLEAQLNCQKDTAKYWHDRCNDLVDELEEAKKEQDMAMADFKALARKLLYVNGSYSICEYCAKSATCQDDCDFAWRGVQAATAATKKTAPAARFEYRISADGGKSWTVQYLTESEAKEHIEKYSWLCERTDS